MDDCGRTWSRRKERGVVVGRLRAERAWLPGSGGGRNRTEQVHGSPSPNRETALRTMQREVTDDTDSTPR